MGRASRRATAAAGAVLIAYAVLLAWDVHRYDWSRGYDAFHNARYTDVIAGQHRLPHGPSETDVWHTPPLFFAVAALLQALVRAVGWPHDAHVAVQYLDVLFAVGIALLAFLLARELWPRSIAAQLGAVGFAVTAPTLARAGVMYHPEALSTLLASAGLYGVVRALRRDRLGVAPGLAAGGLFGLAIVTRTWALSILLAAVLALVLRRAPLRMLAAVLGVAAALSLPWFTHQAVSHGDPFAFNREAGKGSLFSRRPVAFYTALGLPDVFTHPYQFNYLNDLLPTVYSDWWGDYFRYWNVPDELQNDPPFRLPGRYERPRQVQSAIGILPTLLMLGGIVALGIAAVRRRSAPFAALAGSAGLLAVAYLFFEIKYPHHDGDTLKAGYLLSALVPLSVAGGRALAAVMRADRLMGAGAVLLLLVSAALDLRFLTL